ncbi:glycoside hydrolase family 27 protein [Mucilaginibacter sp. FT3.2]|uniref:glycoside hydrolase family 27 protein n=1 Tax=Mucilaginibacter sp. FT3.2 TaxID=2723090 RepID=UPI00160DD9D6|nr:glycoside hydrolase family 27 protein [Mucilaginibacter sp. FT3.2]MBB6232799.1 alpha-galactosidase [Mucilaginibacter sp. FT3.2]
MKKRFFSLMLLAISSYCANAQDAVKKLAVTPPMGWMTWNYYGEDISEQNIKEMADAMANTGMVKAGYQYIMIDDGWQGGRDNRNMMIPDAKKFPSGIKSLADYVHSKGIKLGIYSDAATLTCAGYTASLGFEEQDAKTFTGWGIDYLKYDYCNAPEDSTTAKERYGKMARALQKSGRDITFSVCEWGDRQPWHWAAKAGGQLWRTTADIRNKWKNTSKENSAGIMDVYDINVELYPYASVGHWNDPDMLNVGLYKHAGPAAWSGGNGCTDIEYQSQMSLWCMMASPLITSCNLAQMNEATKRILLNPDVIAIDQDALGKQSARKINDTIWNVLVKPLANGDYAVAILNRGDNEAIYKLDFEKIGLNGKYTITDLWSHKSSGKGKSWKGQVKSHETKLFRLHIQNN